MSSGRHVDAVVLDLGGVLIDWDPRHLFRKLIPDEAEREWFLDEVCGPAWNRRQDEGRTWADAVEQAIRRHPDQATLIRAYDERWMETVAGLFDDTAALVKELTETEVPLLALTNYSAEKWALTYQSFELLHGFDGIVVSGEELVAKPDPAIYHRLIERFDLPPRRTFFTDDVQANVDAARQLGIDAELFVGATQLRGHLVQRGVLRP